MPIFRTSSGAQRVIVAQPASASRGRVAVDLAATYNEAAAAQAAVYVVPTHTEECDVLRMLRPGDVRVIQDGTAESVRLRARWQLAAAAHRVGEWRSRAATAVRIEAHRELRRQAGDHRLPSDLRAWLREKGRELLRATPGDSERPGRLPRRLLRLGPTVSLPPDVLARLSAGRAALGLGGRPIVAMEIGRRPDAYLHAARWLAENGYDVVRVASGNVELPPSCVIDLTRRPEWSALFELYVISTCRFLVCEATDLQQLAYLTSTPTLRMNAREPLSAYPIRRNGLLTLAQPIESETGRSVELSSVVSESFLVKRRGYVFRDNTGPEVAQSVREMHDAVTHGFADAPSQASFRSSVEKLEKDEGFVGEGRLVRWQADRIA